MYFLRPRGPSVLHAASVLDRRPCARRSTRALCRMRLAEVDAALVYESSQYPSGVNLYFLDLCHCVSRNPLRMPVYGDHVADVLTVLECCRCNKHCVGQRAGVDLHFTSLLDYISPNLCWHHSLSLLSMSYRWAPRSLTMFRARSFSMPMTPISWRKYPASRSATANASRTCAAWLRAAPGVH